jgi:hypothetical protein
LETRTLDSRAPLPAPRDRQEWEAEAARLRRQVLAAAGLWLDPAQGRPAPRAEVFESRVHAEAGYAVEKVYFESLPGVLVTGNLYRPWPPRPGRLPAVLHPHGHAAFGRLQHDALFSPAMRGLTFARMGAIAFCYDMPGFGDNVRVPHRWGDARTWLWGASPLGLQLWNSIRALDFLQARPDVDPARMGCTGESGGGTQTFLLTAVDPRVAVSAPVNMVSARMQGGCACENAPGLRLDVGNVHIAALCAPRPLLVVSATGDWTRDVPRVEFPALARIYELLGVRDRVEGVQFDAPHNYHRESREAVYDFFRRHLWAPGGGAPERVPSEDDLPGPDAEEDLRVFARRPWPDVPSGQDALEAVCAWFRAGALERLGPGGPAAKAEVLPFLQAAAGVEAVAPGSVRAEPEGSGTLWLSRPGFPGRFAVRRDDATAPVRLRLPDGSNWGAWPFGGGWGGAPWARPGRAAGVPFFLCYNRSDAAWQAQDLLCALAWAGGRLALLEADAGCAVAAVLARAIAGPAIAELALELGSEWAADREEDAWLTGGAYLPAVLRAGGLTGLLGMAAPAPLRLRTAGPWCGLDALRNLYAAAGGAQALDAP